MSTLVSSIVLFGGKFTLLLLADFLALEIFDFLTLLWLASLLTSSQGGLLFHGQIKQDPF